MFLSQQLDYKVDSKKLKQVFKLAGKVQSVDLSLDKEGHSRGFAVVEYDHPVEAVQAISMLDRQMLYDRRMTVRLDRIPDKGEGLKLPEGLGGVGIGLGPNGEPLKDVAHNLPNGGNQNASQLLGNVQSAQQLSAVAGGQVVGGGNSNASNLLGSLSGVMFGNNAAVQPSPVAPVQKPSMGNNPGGGGGGINLNNLNPSNLAAVVGNLGNLGAALSNPLLTSSLNTLGLNLGNAGGNDDGLVSASNVGLSNNYSSGGGGYGGAGNNYNSGGGTTGSGGGGVSGGNVGYNSYNSSAGGVSNAGNNQLDGNDYGNSGSQLDIYGGGGGNVGGGGGNVGVGVGAGNAGGGGARKSDTIIIKNVPLSCTWQTLRDKFRDVGDVKFAEIRGNDVGVVRFFKERDAELAIGMNPINLVFLTTLTINFYPQLSWMARVWMVVPSK